MVDVALPEPAPDDNEDVIWALSTGAALWARGERTDTVVWVRRAADAARAAGQEKRGSDLDFFALRMERALEEIASAERPQASAVATAEQCRANRRNPTGDPSLDLSAPSRSHRAGRSPSEPPCAP